MPTARYNKQQICGILLQFRAGLGSGGERGLQGALGTGGVITGGLRRWGSHPALAGGLGVGFFFLSSAK